jgi:hypothetical protein
MHGGPSALHSYIQDTEAGDPDSHPYRVRTSVGMEFSPAEEEDDIGGYYELDGRLKQIRARGKTAKAVGCCAIEDGPTLPAWGPCCYLPQHGKVSSSPPLGRSLWGVLAGRAPLAGVRLFSLLANSMPSKCTSNNNQQPSSKVGLSGVG